MSVRHRDLARTLSLPILLGSGSKELALRCKHPVAPESRRASSDAIAWGTHEMTLFRISVVTLWLAIALPLPVFSASQVTAQDPDRPNVLIILADDMGWNDVSFHGGSIPTPNIDRLAEEGVQLDRFYTNPKCTPTRAALLTGRDPLKLGLTYATVYPWSAFGVALSEHFIGETFKAQGYDTAIIGKWHLGHTVPAHQPNNRGFEYFFGSLNTGGDYFTHRNQGGYDLQRNGTSVPELDGQYNTDIYTREAIRWLTELRDRRNPFFLYLPYKAPHSPFQAPQELIDEFGGVYPAMMVSMDRGIGLVLDALEGEGLEEETIVLFLSDNGATRGNGSNAPLRGHKLDTYEGGIRVVSVIRLPGKLQAGTISEQVMTSLDVFPTLAAAAGIEVLAERPLDGVNLWREIREGESALRTDNIIYASEGFVGRQFYFSVLRNNFKLVQRVDQTFESLTVVNELYDVFADPAESNDLSEAHPELVDQLVDALIERRRQHPYAGSHTQIVPHPGWRAPLDWAEAMRLNGLIVNPDADDNVYGFAGPDGARSPGNLLRILDGVYGNRGRLLYQ